MPKELAYFDDEDDQRAKDLRTFYKAAGVQRWSESAKIETRLDPHKRPSHLRSIPASAEDIKAHLADVRAFVAFAKSSPQKAKAMPRRSSSCSLPTPRKARALSGG